MRKILTSLLVVGLVAGAAVWGTSAFFSDTETSTGNVLAAGDIDLQIDNDAWYNGVYQSHLSWEMTDLTIEKFFDYRDLKPGDWEEDTISVHVGSNDAWVCANAQITMDHDNEIVEPEAEAGDVTPLNGELDNELNFVFWVDDGDNVLEDNEYNGGDGFIVEGPLSALGSAGSIALADSVANNIGGTIGQGVSGDSTFFIGKAFCYGEFEFNPIVQDNVNLINPGGQQGPGFTCDGSLVTNQSQTDVIVGNLSFYAEQVRNNPTFQCSNELFPTASPLPTSSPLVLPTPVPTVTPVPTAT